MPFSYSSLVELGAEALSHRSEVDEVKRQVDITHGYFDAWIYGFLENKKFDVEETVAKLHRRFAMEVNELSGIVVTDYMRESLRSGSHQFLGTDKFGRCVFLINIKRDLPDPRHAEERRVLFDLFMSYGSRLRKDGKRCQMVVIFNQDGANTKKNFDLSALLASAKHVAKYYPGALDKTYFCKMGRALTALAKPVLKAFPVSVTNRLEILSDADLKQGALLKVMDAEVLPVALGGMNDCDHPERWCAGAAEIEAYFDKMQRAIRTRGLRVRDYELEKLGISTPHFESLPEGCVERQSSLPLRQPSSTSEVDQGLSHESCSEEVTSFVTTVEEGLGCVQSTVRVQVSSSPLTKGVDVESRADMELHSSGSSTDLLPVHGLPQWHLPACTSRPPPQQQAQNQECDSDDDLGELERAPSWSGSVSSLPSALGLWFLDELLHWRETIEAEELEERRHLLTSFAAVSLTAPVVEKEQRGHALLDRKWYNRPMPGVTPLLLLVALLMNFVALLFIQEQPASQSISF